MSTKQISTKIDCRLDLLDVLVTNNNLIKFEWQYIFFSHYNIPAKLKWQTDENIQAKSNNCEIAKSQTIEWFYINKRELENLDH